MPIKRALLSVSDKTGIAFIVPPVEMISTPAS